MNVKKFIAANARDALRKVKETLGDDAIILSNRGIPGGVEIMAVAARDMAMIVPTPVAEPAPFARAQKIEEADSDYRVTLNAARARVSQPMQAPEPRPSTLRSEPLRNPQPSPAMHAGGGRPISRPIEPPRQPVPPRPVRSAVEAPHPSTAAQGGARDADVVPREVMEEIRSLRKIVEQHLAGFAWGEAARSEPVKTEMLRQMLDAGFSPRFARDLIAELPAEMSQIEAMAWVKGAADRSLVTLAAEEDIVDRGGVFALVGPTGVGKTTTTAKLAARCVLRHGPSRIALVTTDGYRIGAHEQLRIYGRILGVSVHLVKDAVELQQALAELRHKHMVLIDTMGMSQRDKLVPELTDMLSGCDVERLLILSSTSRGDTLDDVVQAYSGEGLSGCILTKIDEAASLATSLDVIMRHRLCLHYISNGQRVPEDLHLPNRGYLLHSAFKDVPESSPHKFDGLEPALVMSQAGLAAAGGARRG